MSAKHPHIVVVGAGIVGASLAYQLARRHARVTLLDKTTKPVGDATEKSFAWITGGHDASAAYLQLRQQAIIDWHRVENEFNGRLKLEWSGALSWQNSSAETERTAHRLLKANCPVRLINRQKIARLEPNLKDVPTEALFAENEGAIDATLATELLLEAAREANATIQLGTEVLSFIINGSRITGVATVSGKIMADLIVVAAGATAPSLCKPLGLILPVAISPSILTSFHNKYRFVNRIVSNPLMEIRAASNTSLVAAEDYLDDSVENSPQAIAQRTLKAIKEHWHGAEHLKLVTSEVGQRPMPQDGLPLIGRVASIPNLYVSVMHAGVTLAALVGRLAAAEILSGQDTSLLLPYRLERFN